MSKYTKTVAAASDADKQYVSKSLKTSPYDSSSHSDFAHIDDASLTMSIDPSKITVVEKHYVNGRLEQETHTYNSNVVNYAEQLKYQHEHDNSVQALPDEFYLQYAQNYLNAQYASKYTKVFPGLDVAPDPKYAQYSYEEIIAMAHNGVNIPKEVLAWAKGQQESDITDYVIISDSSVYSDDNFKNQKNGESEINKIRAQVKDYSVKSKKAQEELINDAEKANEYKNEAANISEKQKNIFDQYSITEIEKNVNRWKELDTKKKEGTITSFEYAEYSKLSEKLDENGRIIKDMQKDAVYLNDFLDSIDNLKNKSIESINIAESTAAAAVNLSNLDDGLNIFYAAHAYKTAATSSSSLAETLNGINDIQLSIVAKKIANDLENIIKDTNVNINNDKTKEIISFSDEYTHTAKHIEAVLDIESYDTNDAEVSNEKANNDEVSQGNNQQETVTTTDNSTSLNLSTETTHTQKDIQDAKNIPNSDKNLKKQPENKIKNDVEVKEEDKENAETLKSPVMIKGENTNVSNNDGTNKNTAPDYQKPESDIKEKEPMNLTNDNEAAKITNNRSEVDNDGLKGDIAQNTPAGKQPEDSASSYNVKHKLEVRENDKASKSDDSASNTEKTNKGEKNNQKQEIDDHQASLKDEYGGNADFVKLVVANNIANLIGLGPTGFTFAILKWAAIAGLSILDLYSKKEVVDKSGELADKDAKFAEDASKTLITVSNQIKAEHDKNFAQSKIYAQQFKDLNNAAIEYQFEMLQNQQKLVQAGRMREEDIIEFDDPTAGEKSVLRKQVEQMAQKDAQLLSSIEGPRSKVQKSMKESNLSSKGFDDLNVKLTDRNDNNDTVGDVIITETIVVQGLITALVAVLMAGGPWCWPLAALWAKVLLQNAAVASTGVAAKLVSDNVEHKIADNNDQLNEQSKSRDEQHKNMIKVDKNIAKAKLDKMDNLPSEKEVHVVLDDSNQTSDKNTLGENQDDNSENNSNNSNSSVLQQSTNNINSGSNQLFQNTEFNADNTNDAVKQQHTNQANQHDERLRSAAASTNINVSSRLDTTDKSDIKLKRFNNDGAIDSKKRVQRVNAAEASYSGRKRK